MNSYDKAVQCLSEAARHLHDMVDGGSEMSGRDTRLGTIIDNCAKLAFDIQFFVEEEEA